MASDKFEKDHGFKAAAIRDPEGLVRTLGGVGWDVPIEVTLEQPEISLRYQADNVCRVTINGREELHHFEADSHFETASGEAALKRAVALGLLHDLRVKPILVMFNPNRPGHSFDPHRRIDLGWVTVDATFLIVRLWEEDPTEIIARNRIHLMPMVIAMKSSPAQIREASMRIEMVTPEDERRRLRQEMATFGTLRYNEAEISALIGRSQAMLPPLETIRETPIGQRIEEIGRYQGRHEGRAEEARRLLHHVLHRRFPLLSDISEAMLPADLDEIEALVDQVLETSDPVEIRKAILKSDRK